MFWQVQKIIKSCPNQRDRTLIETLAFTGMRRVEVATLEISDIDWDKKLLLIRHGKGNKQRYVPIPEELLNSFEILLHSRLSGVVFLGRNGKPLSTRQVNRIVANAGRISGIKNPNPKYQNITCHLFRHTFARLWKSKLGSIETLSSILGHQSVRTTWDVYGKEGLVDIQENYKKTIRQMYKKD